MGPLQHQAALPGAPAPVAQATLADHDWTVNFAEVNHPGDRAAVIVTTPLTTNEQWTAFEPGELKVFVDGAVVA